MQPLPYGSASKELFLLGISQERRPRVTAFLSGLCLAHVPGLLRVVCSSTLFLGANTIQTMLFPPEVYYSFFILSPLLTLCLFIASALSKTPV